MKKRFQTKYSQLSIQGKLFFSIFLGSLLLTVVLTIATFIILFFSFTKNEENFANSHLEYSAKQIDFFLDYVEEYAYITRSTTIVQEIGIANKHRISKFPAHFTLSRIYKDVPLPQFINSISIYDEFGGLIVSTEIVTKKASIAHITNNMTTSSVWMPSEKIDNNLKQQVPVMSYFSKYFNYETGEFLGYIELSIRETQISSLYENHSGKNYSMVMVDNAGIIQSGDDKKVIRTSYKGFSRIGEAKVFSKNFSAKSVVFTRYYSRLNWFFVYEMSLAIYIQSVMITAIIFMVITVAVLIVYLSVSKRISRSIVSPIYAFISHTSTIEKGNWKPIDKSLANDKDIFEMFTAFNNMLTAQDNLKNKLVETQKNKFVLERELLQRQINSHFLYNTLDTILGLVEADELGKLTEMIINLSAFYRYSLSNGKNIITVREELELTKNYLTILQIRNMHRFSFYINCPKELEGFYTIKLLLQVAVENCLEHAFVESNQNNTINVEVYEKDEHIFFEVQDNGVGTDNTGFHHSNNYGLFNVRQRVQLYYGTSCDVWLEKNSSGGCTAVIKIKKEGDPDEKIQDFNS